MSINKGHRNRLPSLWFAVFALAVVVIIFAWIIRHDSKTDVGSSTNIVVAQPAEILKNVSIDSNTPSVSRIGLDDKFMESLEAITVSEVLPKINNEWIYTNEILGMLSLGSLEEAKKAQSIKFASLPSAIAKDVLGCEGMWYLSVVGDIRKLKIQVPQERLNAMLTVARASFEVLLEMEPSNSVALEGLAACYADAGEYDKCCSLLRQVNEAQNKDTGGNATIKTRLALARILRSLGGLKNEQEAQSLYDKLLSGQLKQDTYAAIRAERIDIPKTLNSAGISLYEVPGLSFSSLVGHGVVDHMSESHKETLLRALSSPASKSYSPSWVKQTQFTMDISEMANNVFQTAGFSQNPQLRLYHAIVLFQGFPNNPMALAALGQSLQENNLIDLSEQYYEKALNLLREQKQIPEKDVKLLTSYIYLRQGFNASSAQHPEKAISLWSKSNELDGSYAQIVGQLKRYTSPMAPSSDVVAGDGFKKIN